MSEGNGKKKNKAVCISISDETIEVIDKIAKIEYLSKSGVITKAVMKLWREYDDV